MLESLALHSFNFMLANPFLAAKPLVVRYGGDARTFAYALALFFLILVGIGLTAGSARTRQGLKARLGWILVGVALIAAAGYAVGVVHQDSSNTFHTILPLSLGQLDVFRALL